MLPPTPDPESALREIVPLGPIWAGLGVEDISSRLLRAMIAGGKQHGVNQPLRSPAFLWLLRTRRTREAGAALRATKSYRQ